MLGKPSSVKPVPIWLSAGPWVFDFPVIEWMKHISSAISARFGRRSLTILPDCPRGLNSAMGLTRLPLAPWNVIKPSLPGIGVSCRLMSSGL